MIVEGNKKMIKKILAILTILIITLLAGCSIDQESINQFATCLSENGANLYGSEWCPHCTEQKEMFGESLKLLDYTECTTEQQKCETENIQYLPTWKFADGTVVSGVQSFSFLAEKTGCQLP